VNIHKNARTTPNMRALIVGRRQAGETPRSIAGAVGVSPATVRKWLRRHESEGMAGLQDRTSRPHRLRTRITSHQIAQVEALRRARQPFWKIAREAGLSLSSVARIAKTKGLSRLSALDQRIEIVRYEKKQPGEMIHIDIKKLGRIEGVGHRITGDRTGQSAPRSRKEGGKGWEYLHLAVDDHSRLAYSEILPDETRRSCLKFLFNALRFFRDHGVKVFRVMTDNGVSFRSHRYAKALRMLKIKHKRTRPYTPRTNGKAERFVQTSLREWAKPAQGSSRRSLLEWPAEGYAKPYNHSSERAAALLPFLHHYNHHRPHYGINGKSLISRIPGYNLSTHDI
jgi:transposase